MKNWYQGSYLLFIFAFLYCPIVLLVIFSFNNAQYSQVWHGFTLRWYRELIQDTDLWLAGFHTLILGVTSATIATVMGTFAAVALHHYRFAGRKLLSLLLFIVIISPDIVLGISLLLFYTTVKIPLGFTSLLLAHITFSIPFVVITIYTRMKTLDSHLLEVAHDLGANDKLMMQHIVIPLVKPAMLAGWLLSFTLSIDDVIISYFVSGPEFQILPLKIYSLARLGVKPELNALCSLLFVATLFLVIISQRKLKELP